MADLPGNAAAPFSGYMDSSQYTSEIKAAFAAWSAVTGLEFQEVADSSQTDIRLGWGDLNTQTTGAVGCTTYMQSGGVMQSGTVIELEDPSQDALVSGADGLTYTGTQATLEQVLQHEIGHALGLAENADPNSIMNYDLTATNRTLDATDVNAIQALYGSPSESGASTSSPQLQALIQAMAAYAPPPAASSTPVMTGPETALGQLAASAIH
jgi:predicted Zn-dependent protease